MKTRSKTRALAGALALLALPTGSEGALYPQRLPAVQEGTIQSVQWRGGPWGWRGGWGWRGRPYWYARPWAPRPYYGAIVAGVALGALVTVAVVGRPPVRPAPNLCWYWADPYRNRGYWDYCY